MMLMSGIGLLAAAIPLPQAGASPSRPARPVPAAPPPSSEPPAYIFQDEFDGPAGAGPDPAKWTVWNWDVDVFPPLVGITATTAKTCSSTGTPISSSSPPKNAASTSAANSKPTGEVPIDHTWEARIKFNCMTPVVGPLTGL